VIDPTTVNDATFALTGPETSHLNQVSPSCVPPNPLRAGGTGERWVQLTQRLAGWSVHQATG